MEAGSPSTAPGVPLRTLLVRRGALPAGEVVTLVVPLARTLAALHAAGASHGAVDVDHVRVAADGRAFLTGGRGGGSDRADVAALGRMAMAALGGGGDDALVAVLRTSRSAAQLAAGLLDACAPQPLSLPVTPPPVTPPARQDAPDAQPSTARARTAVIGVAAIALSVAVGVATARPAPAARTVTATPRTDAVAAPVHPQLAAQRPVAQQRQWRTVVAALERRRADAFATGNVSRLRQVYAAGSRGMHDDVARLRATVPPGGQARGLAARVLSVRLRWGNGRRASLVVVDAWTSYDVVVAGRVIARGRASRPHPLLFRLRRTAAGWRVTAVRRAPSSAVRSTDR